MPAGIRDEFLKIHSSLLQLPLQGARTHRHFFCHLFEIRVSFSHRLGNCSSSGREHFVLLRHLFQDPFKVSPHDLVKPFVSGGYLPLKKLTLDNKSIGGIAEQNGRAKNPQVLRGLFWGWVRKTDLKRGPLAS